MGSAKSRPTGLGMESDGTELSRAELPEWNETDIKTYPVVWRSPVTDRLHLQVHPSAVESLVSGDTRLPRGKTVINVLRPSPIRESNLCRPDARDCSRYSLP